MKKVFALIAALAFSALALTNLCLGDNQNIRPKRFCILEEGEQFLFFCPKDDLRLQ